MSFKNHSELKIVWDNVEIYVQQGSITDKSCDAIAISCAPTLSFSSGVAKAVARAAGPSLKVSIQTVKEQLDFSTPLKGETIVLASGDLQANYVIGVCAPTHAYVENAYRNTFITADQRQCSSLCLCAFGTGFLRVPPSHSASKAIDVIEDLIKNSFLNHLKIIRFVDKSMEVVSVLVEEFKKKILTIPNAVATVDGHPISTSEQKLNGTTELNCNLIDPYVDIISEMNDDSLSTRDNACASSNESVCAVCLCEFERASWNDPSAAVKLKKCSHIFHRSCLQKSFEKLQAQCPTCRMWYGVPRGNQPLNAHMHVEERRGKIPGFENCKSYFEIFYNIPSGIQTRDHPRPGNYYHGTSRTAYLPNNEQGQKVLELFKLAFRYRLMFTVGDSVTTGRTDVVVWNSIHNKTSVYGGPQNFGYPDDTYLDRVTAELASVGITEDLLLQLNCS